MGRQRRFRSALFLAVCVCFLLTRGAHAQSGALSCFVGSGVQASGIDPDAGTSYGVSCPRWQDTNAWIFCPDSGSPLQCFGTYRASADGSGIACYDSGGFPSVDSPQFCSRYGGGGGGCASVFQGPQETVVVAIDGEPRTVPLPKSSFVLSRTEAGENDVSYLMEEWAVIGTSMRPGEARPRLEVLKASSVTFAAAKARDLTRSALVIPKGSETSSAESRETLLIVEAPVHPHNSRLAPTPRLELSDTEVPPGISPASVLIRADFSEQEDSPQQVQVLHAGGPVPQKLMDLLKNRLELDRKSMKRHRTIAFAIVKIGNVVELTSLATVMPKCCCGARHCV